MKSFIFSFPGGYILFQSGLVALGSSKKRYETAMQDYEDQGKWKWLSSRVLEKYQFPEGGTAKPLDEGKKSKQIQTTITDEVAAKGIQFIFQKN